MTSSLRLLVTACCLVGLAVALVGCGQGRSSYAADEATQNVGQYPPPPVGIARPKTGVPPFLIEADDLAPEMAQVASDQLTTLLVRTNRFMVIERAQLEQLLKEQSLEGIVRADELAASGQVRGVDYLMIGKITNFRVKREERSGGFGIGRVNLPAGGSVGGLDVSKDKVVITVEAGVDLRLVDPASGATVAADFAEYTRTDESGAFGVDILGANARSDADLEIDADNKGKLLRLALDHTVRKLLPQIDNHLLQLGREQQAAQQQSSGGGAAATGGGGGEQGHKFCTNCGNKLAGDAKFCTKCGTKQGE